jgi:uncharacterized coiled-coil protein SlyX
MSFLEYITEQKNTHMTHIEDKVIYGGVDGTREAILALRSLRDTLAGVKEGKVSVKWDGAPAIFAGIDPSDGKFFVAKKGIFNKNPKVYKTSQEVEADTSGDLASKLKIALQELPKLGIKGVIQGDFLYGPGDLGKEKIKGIEYITFHPNTIVYAIPSDSELAKVLTKSKIGIVWHTEYTGDTFETMKASYNYDASGLKKTSSVFSTDANLKDMTSFTMSAKDTELVTSYLSQAGKLFSQVSGTTLRQLEANQQLAQTIETFNNTYVRQGQVITNTKKHVDNLIKYIKDKYQKEIDARKTEKGKSKQVAEMQKLLDFFSANNRQSLQKLFDLQKMIVLAKLKLINILDKLNKTKTFLKTNRGYRVTGQEGYVAVDKLGGDAVKIVDRMEFSFANFSPSILKGWDKPGR